MPTTPTIRPFADEDEAPCRSIAARAALSSYAPRLPEEAHRALADPDRPLEAVERRLVAVLDGAVVGFVDVNGSHVRNLFVDPAVQGAGVGRRLLAAAEAGIDGDVTLGVFTVNPRARSLYERLGYVVEAERTVEYLGVQARVWAMRKRR